VPDCSHWTRLGGHRLSIVRSLRLLLALALAAPLAAQTAAGTGSISGRVRDSTGSGVPNAAIDIHHPERGVQRTTRTDREGAFSVTALPPAAGYRLSVQSSGFAVQEHVGLEVQVGENTTLDVMLDLSPERTRILVEESAVVADPTRTGVSQVIRSSQIINLPINGRRVDTHVLLTPAVTPDGVQGLVSFRGIAGGNAFLTDGNDTSNQFFHENAGRTRISTQISQDAVQEFQVLSTGYSAEYGRASGGIINTVTRSGSNKTAGTAYWFFRNRSFNARDPHTAINPPEQRHQAGASLGGALVRDKLFYFFNGEVHRRDFPIVSSLSRPPLFDPAGRFTGTCDLSRDVTPQQCTAALAFLNRNFQVIDRNSGSELGFGRLDWRPTNSHLVSASFNYLRWASPNGYQTQAVLNNGEGLGDNGSSNVRTRYGRIAWTAIRGGSHINELRFGWFKDRHADNLNPQLLPPGTGLAQIVVEGQKNLGVLTEAPRLNPSENRFQLAENFTWIHGRHMLKTGTDLLRTQEYLRYLRNRNGTYEYGDFTSFALDFSGNTGRERRWQTYSQRFGNEIFDQVIADYNFFVQDQFRVSPSLTFNYGLRYEYAGLPQPAAVHIPTTKKNFAPRVGLAIALDRSRTVLRAGYGMFHARYHGGVISTFFLENGVYQKSIQFERRFLFDPPNGPVFPAALPASFASSTSAPTDLTFPSPDYRNPYTQQGDIGIEHAFHPNFSLNVTYLWSRGLHLTTVRDINIGPPGDDAKYEILDTAGRLVDTYVTPTYRLLNRVDPRWRRLNLVESGGNSYYNALAVQIRRRLHNGFEGFVSYTWSHAIDFNQGGGSDNIFFSEGPRSLWNGDYRGEKGSSQLDQRHRLIFASTYETPMRRTGGWLLNRWRISQISIFASAQPATPIVLVSGVPFPGAAFNSTLNGFGGSARVPFLPPASLDIGRVARTDARLTKLVRVSDAVNLHLNFEVFNVFNHSAITAVNTVAYEARNSVLRPLPRLGEGVESQGYPDGTNARRAQVSLRLTF
jgi:hypothetical protein